MVLKIFCLQVFFLSIYALKLLCSVWNMVPYNPDKKHKSGVNAVTCHAVSSLAYWITSGTPESQGLHQLT